MIKLYLDAAFKPATKEMGIGIIIHSPQSEPNIFKYYISHVAENHIAEFIALWCGLKLIGSLKLSQEWLLIYSDSQIVVDSVEKDYVKNKDYQPWLRLIRKELAKIDNYIIQHAHEKANAGVDAIAKQALHQQGKVKKLVI